jgi:hypothetical protein
MLLRPRPAAALGEGVVIQRAERHQAAGAAEAAAAAAAAAAGCSAPALAWARACIACTLVTQMVLTMSGTVQPRDRSLTGLDKP